jgi:hypothetical protein
MFGLLQREMKEGVSAIAMFCLRKVGKMIRKLKRNFYPNGDEFRANKSLVVTPLAGARVVPQLYVRRNNETRIPSPERNA